jgi:hypothetical protein
VTDIVCFWDRNTKQWVVVCTDAEGNQLWGCQFFPNTEALRAQFFLKG